MRSLKGIFRKYSNPNNEYLVIIFSPHADGNTQKSFAVHKTFLELHSKTELQHSPKKLKKTGTYFKTEKRKKKKNRKKAKTLNIFIIFWHHLLIGKHIIYPLFKAKIFTPDAKLKALAHSSSQVCSVWAWPRVNIYSESVWDGRAQITPDKM